MLNNEHLLSFLLEVDADFSPPLSSRLNLAAYANKIQANAIVVEDIIDGNLIKGIAATYANDESTRTAYLTFIAVKTCFRGLGVARKLIEKTEHILVKKGFFRLRLEVYKGNEAINLYKRLGFEIYKEDSGSYYMEKDITVQKCFEDER
ncbi:GNAT family N-acetyltransferase [Shewanella glacialipiscicola]|uniref:GNAT family N-acetyltransferase n=1 Tax=Shewanella glacialipiscicola TaxID=614069 RepID=UPI0021DB6A02|nr:N-acetyltransferase [Shewanella glacialipiscicola]MCU7995609.1 GNAT family N-acetyltransferase [Shewanella glacialipiscicola]MCU8026856.1 GNAT family N-acetyltransferase [Shewanella glacialipiscicola]